MAARMTAYANRPGQTASTSDGSRTITIHEVPTEHDDEQNPPDGGDAGSNINEQNGVLRLRGGGNTRRVVWSEETVDNEGMGKKKSKICCIYHKPKAFDESSDESSSSSSLSAADSAPSDSESDSLSIISQTSTSSQASRSSGVNASKSLRETKSERRKKKEANHECSEGHKHAHRNGSKHQKTRGSSTVTETVSKPVPNAYEQGHS